jgi:RAB protein geranylgeranyltransferase component A
MSEENDARARDDGLASEYDLILLGTGLVQSIVSCVASKHGKKVLHLESNEYYGEDYCCHNLTTHVEHYSKLHHKLEGGRRAQDEGHASGGSSHVQLNADAEEGVVVQWIDNITQSKAQAKARTLNKASLTHPACFGYAMEKERAGPPTLTAGSSPVFEGYVTHHDLTKARLWLKDRDFNIDTTTKVLYGSCPMVDLMVASGVSNYLEFRTFEGLYFWLQSTTVGDGQMWKVPCSRNDVFNTTVLGALEKRSLMKFHQFVADWGRAQVGTEVTSLNEAELAVGRSLYRPQNKQQAFAGFNVEAFIDRPFVEFLADCKISPKLQNIIIYALCCHTAPTQSGHSSSQYTTRQGLADMFMHVDSIGRFGETAFLSPLYGSSEVVQAFCRMSAVWGGTFILRRSVADLSWCDGADGVAKQQDGAADKEPDSEAAAAAVKPRTLAVTDTEGTTIRCGAFVCSAGYWPAAPTRPSAILTCTSVWLGTVVPVSRSVIIIPPSSAGAGSAVRNHHAVHIVQSDASTHAAPEGAVVLHLTTVLDFASDRADTAWRDQAEAHASYATELVDTVLRLLLTAEGKTEAAAQPQELSRVVTLKPVYDLERLSQAGAGGAPNSASFTATLPHNVCLCAGVSDAALSMQGAYDQARAIFERLFPDLDFTLADVAPLSEEVQQQQISNGVEPDDEAAYLEFALNSATEGSKASTTDAESEQEAQNNNNMEASHAAGESRDA